MITMGKKYKTVRGEPVKILTTQACTKMGGSVYPVIGLVGDKNVQQIVMAWDDNGNTLATRYNLVEAKTKVVKYTNIYSDSISGGRLLGTLYDTEADADAGRFGHRIAVAKIEWEE